MARIERYTSTAPVPVEQAQLQTTVENTPMIDASAFKFSTATAETLRNLGGVLEELGRRRLAAQDSLSMNAVSESRDLAKLQMQKFMLDNPDPSKWSEGAQKILANHRKVFAKQRFSPQALAKERIEEKAFSDELNEGVSILATNQTIDNDITISGKNLIAKISTDDGSTQQAVDIAKQLEMYQAALERKYPPEVAAIQLEETLKEATKERVSVLATSGNFEMARDAIKEAKGLTVQEKNGLYSSVDVAENYATAVDNEQLKIQQEKDKGKIYDAIYDGSVTRDLIENTSLEEDEQQSLWELAQREIKAKAEGKDGPLSISKPDTYWPLYRRVANDPDSVPESEIADLVGKGISIDNYKELMKKKQKEVSPIESLRTDTYLKLILNLYNGGYMDVDQYEDKATKMVGWIKKNPAATPKQAKEYYDDLTEDVRENTVWQWLKGGGMAGQVYRWWTKGEEEVEVPEIPRPKTEEEYNKIPSGTEYIAPDGTRRTKQ